MKVGAEAVAAQIAAAHTYQQRIDAAADRKAADKQSDLAARDQLRSQVVSDRRHREKIEAAERGGLDIDA